MPAPPIPVVCDQHVESTCELRQLRSALVRAPHVQLHQLGRLDERLAAHLDAIGVAGTSVANAIAGAEGDTDASTVFAHASWCLRLGDVVRLRRAIALSCIGPEGARGLVSALGWEPTDLSRRTASELLSSTEASALELGLSAGRLLGLDPGHTLAEHLGSDSSDVCIAAVRLAVAQGRSDMAEALAALTDHGDTRVCDAAWAARILLRDRALDPEPVDPRSPRWRLTLASIATDTQTTLDVVRMSGDCARSALIQIGLLGDPGAIPWLIDQMATPHLARLAGESFTLITGADLAALDLEAKPPEEPIAGPNDDPEDENVALDEDEHLPWPDVAKVHAWWKGHAHRFPPGQRWFVGGPITWEHLLHVLKTGTQRQRALAATWRCLLRPGTPLFNIAAPAWRQQRELAALT